MKKSKLKKRLTAGILIASVTAVGCLRAGAATNLLSNGDFSNYNSSTGAIADWNVSGDASANPHGVNYAIYQVQYPNPYPGPAYTGVVLYGQYNPSTVVSQASGYEAKLGDTFTATVDLIIPFTGSDALTSNDLALTLDGNIVAGNVGVTSVTPVGDHGATFDLLTVNYTVIDPSLVGDAVGVELLTPGPTASAGNGSFNTQYYYDNATLSVQSAAATPEPSTWAMLFGGMMALLGFNRLRRKA